MLSDGGHFATAATRPLWRARVDGAALIALGARDGASPAQRAVERLVELGVLCGAGDSAERGALLEFASLLASAANAVPNSSPAEAQVHALRALPQLSLCFRGDS